MDSKAKGARCYGSRKNKNAVFLAATAAVCACAPYVDLEQERAALLDADRAFLVESQRRGADGWVDFFLPDGVMFPGNGRVDGWEAIREAIQPAFDPDGPRLLWEPGEAFVSESGDLGYTIGKWRTVTATDPDSIVGSGNYLTVWRKDESGDWKVAADIGNSDAGS